MNRARWSRTAVLCLLGAGLLAIAAWSFRGALDARPDVAGAVDSSSQSLHSKRPPPGASLEQDLASRELITEDSTKTEPSSVTESVGRVDPSGDSINGPTMTLELLVVDPFGKPLQDIPVTAYGRHVTPIGPTDVNGLATASIPVMYHLILVNTTDSTWSIESLQIAKEHAPFIRRRCVLYPRTSDLRLLVQDDVGVPVADASLKVASSDGAIDLKDLDSIDEPVSTTDENGFAVFTRLPTGRPLAVTAQRLPANAHLISKQKLEPLHALAPGRNEHTIVLKRQGTLVLRAAPALLDRLAKTRSITATVGKRRHHLSHSTPEITVWLDPGLIRLAAWGPEPLRLAADRELKIESGKAHTWTIDHLRGNHTVQGQVLDLSGNAISRVRVRVWITTEDRQPAITRTDAEGRFRFTELPNERMRVTVLPDPAASAWTLPANSRKTQIVNPIASGANTTTVNFALEPGYAVRGFVRDGGQIDKRTTATIALIGPLPEATQRTMQPTSSGNHWAMPGEFLFSNLAAGTYNLRIQDEDATPLQIVLGPGVANSTARVNLTID